MRVHATTYLQQEPLITENKFQRIEHTEQECTQDIDHTYVNMRSAVTSQTDFETEDQTNLADLSEM